MKKSICIFAATMFIGGSILTSCKSSTEKIDKAKENVSEAKQDLTKAEKDYSIAIEEFRKETNEKIAANEKNIAECR